MGNRDVARGVWCYALEQLSSKDGKMGDKINLLKGRGGEIFYIQRKFKLSSKNSIYNGEFLLLS